jgi:hypothetical protein
VRDSQIPMPCRRYRRGPPLCSVTPVLHQWPDHGGAANCQTPNSGTSSKPVAIPERPIALCRKGAASLWPEQQKAFGTPDIFGSNAGANHGPHGVGRPTSMSA